MFVSVIQLNGALWSTLFTHAIVSINTDACLLAYRRIDLGSMLPDQHDRLSFSGSNTHIYKTGLKQLWVAIAFLYSHA